MTEKFTFTRDKYCKHSVRYSADDDQAPVSSVYVSRVYLAQEFGKEIPNQVAVAVSAIEE